MRKINRKSVFFRRVVTIVLFAAGARLYAVPPDVLQNGIALHNTAESAADGRAEQSMAVLKPYIDSSAAARAYYGSAMTKTAAYYKSSNPIKSLGLLKKGTAFIDEAVKKQPDDSSLRILRLVNGIQISRSSPVKRYQVIKNDVGWFMEDGHIAALNKADKTTVSLYAGYYYVQANDIDTAVELFQDAVTNGSGTPDGAEAAAMLRKYE
jgi:hypothetical protein